MAVVISALRNAIGEKLSEQVEKIEIKQYPMIYFCPVVAQMSVLESGWTACNIEYRIQNHRYSIIIGVNSRYCYEKSIFYVIKSQ